MGRWFQFGAFTPIFRVHGAGSNTEIWNYGSAVESRINTSAIVLRYRLLPYTYSNFFRAESSGSTVQRALVMDFPSDMKVRDIADQFMWGDAFLVCPFYKPGTSRDVYLPFVAGAVVGTQQWINFHTGAWFGEAPGMNVLEASIDQAPLLVRAGSIVSLGPVFSHALQKNAMSDPFEIRVYPSVDSVGTFSLYEDDGMTRSQDV